LLKKAVSHQVPKARDLRRRDHPAEVRDLDEILFVDAEARLGKAESGVTTWRRWASQARQRPLNARWLARCQC